MITKITQTFIKTMRAYIAGKECGHIIRESFVNDRLFEQEEPGAMALGAYFEYKLSGALPKDGKIPQAVLMKSGDPDAKYRMAAKNAEVVKKLLSDYGLTILHVGKRLTKGKFEGTLDLIVKCTSVVEHGCSTWSLGDIFVIDLKYSGLIDDRWSIHGWAWTPEQKKYHGTQAIQYSYVAELPFYFLVTGPRGSEESNTKNGPEIRFFRVPVDDFMIEQHLLEGIDLMEKFLFYKDIGFAPLPSFSKCSKCPLREECKDRQLLPSVETVDLNVE